MEIKTVLARVKDLLEQFKQENSGTSEYVSAKQRVFVEIGVKKKSIKAEISEKIDRINDTDFFDRPATSKSGAEIIKLLSEIEGLKGQLKMLIYIQSII